MNQTWKTFLVEQGAHIDDAENVSFGTPPEEVQAAAGGGVLADLSHLGLVRASGDDAESFLQGQFSNDIKQVDAEHSQLSAYCNPKGRMFTVFRLTRHSGAMLLQLPAAVQESVTSRLRMYVLRAKVTLTDARDELAVIGYSGNHVPDKLERLFGGLPAQVDATRHTENLTVIRVPGPQQRFQVIGPAVDLMDLWRDLAGAARPVGPLAWRWLDIRAGIPTIWPATSEAFVPQMTNLEVLGGVNFKKGCYPGQEIVARMHYLGRLKQRMYLCHCQAAESPRAGDAVYAPDFGEQAAGTVVDAMPAPRGGFDLLAVLQISAADAGELHLRAADGPALGLDTLPYALPSAERATTE